MAEIFNNAFLESIKKRVVDTRYKFINGVIAFNYVELWSIIAEYITEGDCVTMKLLTWNIQFKSKKD